MMLSIHTVTASERLSGVMGMGRTTATTSENIAKRLSGQMYRALAMVNVEEAI
jgi:hypothetical protein